METAEQQVSVNQNGGTVGFHRFKKAAMLVYVDQNGGSVGICASKWNWEIKPIKLMHVLVYIKLRDDTVEYVHQNGRTVRFCPLRL